MYTHIYVYIYMYIYVYIYVNGYSYCSGSGPNSVRRPIRGLAFPSIASIRTIMNTIMV